MYGSLEIKSAKKILQEMVNFVVARTSLSDLLPASTLTQALHAAARSDEAQYLQIAKVPNIFSILRAKGADLSLRAFDYNTERKKALFAVGTVYFTRTNAVATALTIPVGTVVASPSGLKFVTLTVATIPALGTQSNSVGIIADLSGSDYNLATGAVSNVVTAFEGVGAEGLVCTNPAPTQDGDDEESDPKLRDRLIAITLGLNRTSPLSLPARALLIQLSSGQRVQTAKLIEDPANPAEITLYIDDGTGTVETSEAHGSFNVVPINAEELIASATGGEFRFKLEHPPVALNSLGVPVCALYLNTVGLLAYGVDWNIITGTGQIVLATASFPTGLTPLDKLEAVYVSWTGLIKEVQYDLDGRESDPTTYPGGRAAGVHLVVRAPSIYKPAITVQVTVTQGYDSTTARNAVRDALLVHINSLGIGSDVVIAELYDVAMDVDGVKDFLVKIPVPQDPAANIAVADNQLVRLTIADLTVV